MVPVYAKRNFRYRAAQRSYHLCGTLPFRQPDGKTCQEGAVQTQMLGMPFEQTLQNRTLGCSGVFKTPCNPQIELPGRILKMSLEYHP